MTPSRDWPRRRSVGSTASPGSSSTTTQPRRTRSRSPSWKPGATSVGFAIPIASIPGSTGSSSDRARTHAGAESRRGRLELPWLGNDEPVSDDTLASIAAADQLERGLRLLTIEQRTVLVLAYYLDLSLADAAATLGIPTGTMKSRLNRSLAALRAALDADERRPARTVEQPT